jgi:hypothetical protein
VRRFKLNENLPALPGVERESPQGSIWRETTLHGTGGASTPRFMRMRRSRGGSRSPAPQFAYVPALLYKTRETRAPRTRPPSAEPMRVRGKNEELYRRAVAGDPLLHRQ